MVGVILARDSTSKLAVFTQVLVKVGTRVDMNLSKVRMDLYSVPRGDGKLIDMALTTAGRLARIAPNIATPVIIQESRGYVEVNTFLATTQKPWEDCAAVVVAILAVLVVASVFVLQASLGGRREGGLDGMRTRKKSRHRRKCRALESNVI